MSVAPTCASVFTMVSMSLDRYMAIVHPLRPRLSKGKTIGAVVSIWILASICGLPHAIATHAPSFFFFHPPNGTDTAHPSFASHDHYTEIVICHGDNYSDGNADSSRLYQLYNTFLLCITYLIPLVVLVGTYAVMGRQLWGAQAIGEGRQDEALQAKRRVVVMMIVIVSAFMICWLPYHLYFTILSALFKSVDNLLALYIYLNIYWLAMSSTCINPVICAFMNARFRTGFLFVFRWLPCIRFNRRDYDESELVRDPRKHSVSGLYRIRSTALPKRRPQRRETASFAEGTAAIQLAENGRPLLPDPGGRPLLSPPRPGSLRSRSFSSAASSEYRTG